MDKSCLLEMLQIDFCTWGIYLTVLQIFSKGNKLWFKIQTVYRQFQPLHNLTLTNPEETMSFRDNVKTNINKLFPDS